MATAAEFGEISPRELHTRLATDRLVLVDVREIWEFDLCRIEGAINIPLQTLPTRCGALDLGVELVMICHHGMRSDYAAAFLRDQGFSNVLNLSGGVDRWARDVDPSMPQY